MSRRTHIIFNYGSNSTPQLRARLRNVALHSQRATLAGYVRVFAGYSASWLGSVGSLAEDAGGFVRGSVVTLSTSERAILDGFETGYVLTPVTVTVHDADGNCSEKNAHTYIKAGTAGAATPFPSEAYLCAIAGMLAEHWPKSVVVDLPVRAAGDGGAAVVRGHWTHPHKRGCQVFSMSALAVEINLRQRRSWTMPQATFQFKEMAGGMTVEDVWRMCEEQSVGHAVRAITAGDAGGLNVDLEDMEQALSQIVADSKAFQGAA